VKFIVNVYGPQGRHSERGWEGEGEREGEEKREERNNGNE
jgi:hypothetical protein